MAPLAALNCPAAPCAGPALPFAGAKRSKIAFAGPLTEDESSAYVLGRLADVGARTPLFDAEQLAALHVLADGLPRRLNRLADLALLVAFAEGLPRPDARCLDVAALEVAPNPLLA